MHTSSLFNGAAGYTQPQVTGPRVACFREAVLEFFTAELGCWAGKHGVVSGKTRPTWGEITPMVN